jgi:RNA polymerase sigma-70 factor (ECF subfamily)
LENLCRTYWYPLYAFIRRQNYSPEEAEDIAQAFFADLLAKRAISEADQEKGRFRSFLLARLKNFLSNWRRLSYAQKRGGGKSAISIDEVNAEDRYQRELVDTNDPAKEYERNCAIALLSHAIARLKSESEAHGNLQKFEQLKPFLLERGHGDYVDVGEKLGMKPGAVAVAVARLRHRFRKILEAEIAGTVSSPEEVAGEIQYVLAIFSV